MAELNKRYFVEAVERALRIIEVLSSERRPQKLNEVAAAVGMESSTVFRLLYTLEVLGYLDRDDAKRYSLGPKMLAQGMAALSRSPVVDRAEPIVEALYRQTGVTADLAIRDGLVAVVVLLHKTPDITNVYHRVGFHLPVHACAVGKALLSDMSRSELEDLMGPGPFPRVAPNTTTTLEGLLAEIEQARQLGYATADQEVESQIRGVAAPVRDSRGKIVAAVSLTVTVGHMTLQALVEEMSPLVIAAGRQISLSLGAPPWRGV